MPEQITPLSVPYLLLHGAGTAVGTVLCFYLLLCRGKAIAPDITPPARLRRWAAALFGIMAMALVWWILSYTYLDDTRSVIYGLLVAIDCMALPPVFVGTLLNMLQDRRRPLWPTVIVMTPCAVIAVADSLARHRPHDAEHDLWTGARRGLHYIYGGGREKIWAVIARQLRRPGAQGGVAQPSTAHRLYGTAHEL